MTDVAIVGATGLVGSHCIRQLENVEGVTVTALVRKESQLSSAPNVRSVVFDFESDASYQRIGTEIPCDVILCCLGTTIKKAGSAEAFRRVDRDYPCKLLARLQDLGGQRVFGFISSLGADKPFGLYLKSKAEVESAIFASGLNYVVVRPSLLLGEREEFRMGEVVMAKTFMPLINSYKSVFKSMPKGLKRILPIEASQVARAMIHYSLNTPSPRIVAEGAALTDINTPARAV